MPPPATSPDPRTAALIGVDWGTSHLRVHLVGGAGEVLATRRSDAGILAVPGGGFEAALRDAAGDWLQRAPGVPVLACGMVGSRQGWAEVPYAGCPADAAVLARGLVPVPLADHRGVLLVPGVACRGSDGTPDVIRGEETKIAGAARDLGEDARVCLPGTHAKWALCGGGALRSFRTSMTGEVYHLLMSHGILGRMARAQAPFSPAAFRRGVARSGAGGGLLHHLFSARTLRLFDELGEDEAGAYLSGVLVGADVRAMCAGEPERPVWLVGEGAPCDAYREAMAALDVPARVVSGDAAVCAGLARIARAAGIVEGAR